MSERNVVRYDPEDIVSVYNWYQKMWVRPQDGRIYLPWLIDASSSELLDGLMSASGAILAVIHAGQIGLLETTIIHAEGEKTPEELLHHLEAVRVHDA